MEVHGFNDKTVPANISNGFKPNKYVGPHDSAVSNDGFYYTQAKDILSTWGSAFGCSGSNSKYPTKFDGTYDWGCNKPAGDCGDVDVVQCTGTWGHTWALCPKYPCENFDFAEVTLDFFKSHPKKNLQRHGFLKN